MGPCHHRFGAAATDWLGGLSLRGRARGGEAPGGAGAGGEGDRNRTRGPPQWRRHVRVASANWMGARRGSRRGDGAGAGKARGRGAAKQDAGSSCVAVVVTRASAVQAVCRRGGLERASCAWGVVRAAQRGGAYARRDRLTSVPSFSLGFQVHQVSRFGD
jgi:hypothetical protein